MLTSTMPGEGKSTLAYNLAIAAASHGVKVLFVDADLRKQADRKHLTEEKGRGLASVVAGKCTLKEAVYREKETGVDFLGGNKPVKGVQQILNHSHFHEVMEEMKAQWDLILLDAPPVEMFEDASILGGAGGRHPVCDPLRSGTETPDPGQHFRTGRQQSAASWLCLQRRSGSPGRLWLLRLWTLRLRILWVRLLWVWRTKEPGACPDRRAEPEQERKR